MKKLQNTLYVTSQDSYLALDGENVVILEGDRELGRLPLHNLEGIVSFGYRGASPALMGACAKRDVSLCFLTPQAAEKSFSFPEALVGKCGNPAFSGIAELCLWKKRQSSLLLFGK